MQKIISSLLLAASLLLLLLTMAANTNAQLSSLPPFCGIAPEAAPEGQDINGKDLSISSKSAKPSGMYARAYCLLDADSGRTLFGENEDQQMPMASTTKIMTCIIALENGSLDSKVSVSPYAASMPDVQLNMQSGDTFYLKDLLYSLMLESHNDTAVAIAEAVGGSVEGFADLMNQKAEELGCTDTHFVTPNGLDANEHYTTAKELCTIASYAIQNEKFLKIIQTPSHRFSNCDGTRSYSVRNHDAFLTSYSGAIGIKTGFTGKAGYCFCGAARRDGKTLITSVLACGWPPHKGYKWIDTKKLMDFGFANFKTVSIKQNKLPKTLPVSGGTQDSVAIKRTSSKPLTVMLCESDKITVKYKLSDILKAPVRQGDIIGYEKYYLNKKLLCQSPIIADGSVQKRDWKYYAKIIKNIFFWNTTSTSSS